MFEPNPSATPRYDVEIDIINDDSVSHNVSFAIYGAGTAPLAERHEIVGPGEQRELQPFVDFADTGRESFRVAVRVDDGPVMNETAEMNRCYGGLDVLIEENGDSSVGSVVC